MSTAAQSDSTAVPPGSQQFIHVVNWDRLQHYKHRSPPWIKLYGELLNSRIWVTSDDASRTLAIAIMLLASRHDNNIPLDPAYIKRVAFLNQEPDFTRLIESGFIEINDASNVLANCTQDASNLHRNALPELELEEEEEKEKSLATSESFAQQLTRGNGHAMPEVIPNKRQLLEEQAQQLLRRRSGLQ